MIIAYKYRGFLEFLEADFKPNDEFPLDSVQLNHLVTSITESEHEAVGCLAMKDKYLVDILSQERGLLPKEFNIAGIVAKTIPKAKATLKKYGRLMKNGNFPSFFFLAKGSKLFLITPSAAVVEPPIPIALDGDPGSIAIVHDIMGGSLGKNKREFALKALDGIERYKQMKLGGRTIVSLFDGKTIEMRKKG